MRLGSGAAERTAERSPAVAWYSRVISSASAPVSRRFLDSDFNCAQRSSRTALKESMSTPLRCHNQAGEEGHVSYEDEILIGEGVALESGAAPVTLRILSGVIDYVVTIGLLIFVFASVGRVSSNVEGAWAA